MTSSSKPLVSIITPCYNGENFVRKFLDSVLAQTYDNIELIFINDGSNDNTENIVLSYKNRFEVKGVNFIYIFQENAGQAAALNQGLKIFKGEFLTWPDSDDILSEDSIKTKVDFLIKNPSYGMVRSNAQLFDLNTGKRIERISNAYPNTCFKEDIFLDLFTEKTFCTPGCYMLRSSLFIECYPTRQIYAGLGSQNWQMLVPAASRTKCGYIDIDLFYIGSHPDSFCRRERDLMGWLMRYDDHKNILLDAFLHSECDKEGCINLVEEKYSRMKLLLAYKFKNKELAKEQYSILREKKWLSHTDNIIYKRTNNRLFDYTCSVAIFPIRVLRKIKNLIIKIVMGSEK